MAVLKHIAIKNADYSAAVCYLKYQHDERHLKPLLDENGNMMLRSEFHMNGVNCNPDTFDLECEMLNDQYRKNYRYDEVKSHHYIISFDPRDKDEHNLTGEKAQTLGLEFVKEHLPGHQALVCTHMDGHNGSGNIHVHIIINSLRKLDIEPPPHTTRTIDCKAGYKHHLTKDYLKYLQQELMNLCQRENLYQVDLLSPAQSKITEAEYWLQKRGQKELEDINEQIIADGMLHQKKVLAFYYAFFGCHPRSSTSIYKKILRVKCNQNARATTADKASNHNKGVLIHEIRRNFSLLVYDNHITDTKWTTTEVFRSMLF